ncbi:MAG TPA: alpha/beta hydrolase [Segetibacter sp.]
MEKLYLYKNTKIAYSVAGEGRPVVLLHGFAEDHTIWNNQVNVLQKHYRVIAIDLPGSGSSNILAKEDTGIEDYAKLIDALLENEGIDTCVMIGHSMGGHITIAYAALFSARLTAFGFVHSTAFADSEDKKQTRAKGIKFMEEHGVYTFLKTTTPNLFAVKFKSEQPEKINELVEKGHSIAAEALIQYYRAMMNRPDRTVTLKNSKVPVLFVIGTEDAATPLTELLQQVHLPAIANIHILNEVGHMSMLEKPEELAMHIHHFINKFTG